VPQPTAARITWVAESIVVIESPAPVDRAVPGC